MRAVEMLQQHLCCSTLWRRRAWSCGTRSLQGTSRTEIGRR
uniref:Uncharacterized protein n=1 Tax=Arundo donax TaxID=35708 RepID=A0A0A9H5T7_ARUDO